MHNLWTLTHEINFVRNTLLCREAGREVWFEDSVQYGNQC